MDLWNTTFPPSGSATVEPSSLAKKGQFSHTLLHLNAYSQTREEIARQIRAYVSMADRELRHGHKTHAYKWCACTQHKSRTRGTLSSYFMPRLGYSEHKHNRLLLPLILLFLLLSSSSSSNSFFVIFFSDLSRLHYQSNVMKPTMRINSRTVGEFV